MTPAPGVPSNPQFIVGDTSALLQLVIADQVKPLRSLKSDYGIQCVVHEAVEYELTRKVKQKWPDRLKTLDKALGSSLIGVLSERLLQARGYSVEEGRCIIDRIDALGDQYYIRVDYGEAYTHAAANVLHVPALSYDIQALRKLLSDGVRLERPILRAFDMFTFAFQIGAMSNDECRKVRKVLMKAGEAIPACFANCSYADGLPKFFARLLDRDQQLVGANGPIGDFDDRLWVSRLLEGVCSATSYGAGGNQ